MTSNNDSNIKVLYPGLKNYILENCDKLSNDELYKNAQKKFKYKNVKHSFIQYIGKLKRKKAKSNKKEIELEIKKSENIPIEKLISILKRNQVISITDLCNNFDISPKKLDNLINLATNDGYQIYIKNQKVIFNIDKVNTEEVEKIERLENQEITFGVASDLHFGSKWIQITALHKFAEICKSKGVKHIFCPGDIFAGNNVYRGQIYDLYAIGSDEQIESARINLPTGFEYYIMGGNHDYSFIRSGGQNPLVVLSNKRKDIHYCGFDEVDIPILENVDLKMWHPSGGVPYSVSYRLQKGIEQVAFSELQSIVRGVKDKPTIRFVLAGHLHIQMQALFGSIFGCQCGTFEGQTNYLKVKGLVPAIGGYIIKASLGKNGLLRNFDAKFYVFEEIEDDWKSYNHNLQEEDQSKIFKPIFE